MAPPNNYMSSQTEQAYDNLPEVMQDQKEAEKGANFLGIDYFGPRDKFKMNKDLEDPE